MHKTKLISFFESYIAAFKQYELNDVLAFYHFPCTLHTPDKMVLLCNVEESLTEFKNIFTQLKQAQTKDIKVTNASYSQVCENVILASVDWAFIDDQDNNFADFCAIYHLIILNNQLKIFNVVSHELSNSIVLDNSIVLTN